MNAERLRTPIVVVALLGIAISGYLTYVHYAGIEPICAASGGCEKVQSSDYAKLAGIPVALLGLLGYVSILAASLARGELARMVASSLSLIGLGFSLYLTYLELFEIDAICQWCVGSAVTMTVLTVLTVLRAVRGGGLESPAQADG
ncbi:MAG TPA: vitamin K epoxide reductase family protein [Thermoleophilaceae bacterium]